MEIIAPKINLNGTSKEALIKEYRAAHLAIDNAIEVLSKVTVHGRDFQTEPVGTFEVHQTQHVIRLKSMEHVKLEIESICLKLMAQ